MNGRAEEIAAAAARWDRAGNTVLMVTLTAPHDLGMRLRDLLPMIAGSFTDCLRGRPWLRLKADLSITGTIRAVEITHGINGWHPHLHVLVFIEGDPGARGLVAVDRHFSACWRKSVTAAGYRAPDDMHGIQVERCESAAEAGAYIAKTSAGRSVGNEITRGDLKAGRPGHRTPWQVLEDFRQTGDLADLQLWREYERATKGHQCVTWSKNLKRRLAVADRTDEAIAAEDVGGQILALLPLHTWREVTRLPGLPCYLLDCAERQGAAGIRAALARYGIQPEQGPGP